MLRGDASQNLLLRSEDVTRSGRGVVVTVFVMGEVRNPGKQVMPAGATVLDAISRGRRRAVYRAAWQGVSDPASRRKLTRMPLDLGWLLGKLDQKQNPVLQDGDLLYLRRRTWGGRMISSSGRRSSTGSRSACSSERTAVAGPVQGFGTADRRYLASTVRHQARCGGRAGPS